MEKLKPDSGLARAARYAVPFVLLLIPFWMIQINAVVPEPYLDEEFHVPQAQTYWEHKWTQWNPKITTPPGLYFWSYAICAALLAVRGSPTQLSTEACRGTNVAAATVFLPWRLQKLLDQIRKQRNDRPSGAWLSHTVLNICLFPPLFFFSGLYYTDILALLAVVEAYNWDLKRMSGLGVASVPTFVFTGLGVAALAFRQTNIFWVAIFLGGLRVIRKLRVSSKPCQSTGFVDVARRGYNNELFDPLVSEASFLDYSRTAISLGAASLGKLRQVTLSLVPYLLILAAFGGFVAWNNGVVLGHKEFHTVGLHLSQMLYIWPYFLFFSWPILVVPVINLLLPQAWLPKFVDYGFPRKQKGLPKVLTTLIIVPLMLAVVHFNTVVHPFTLADNRHYIFYVFRILLGYHPAVKYAAVAAYFYCGWMVLAAFGFSTVPLPPKLVPAVPAGEKPAQQGQKKDTRTKQKTERQARLTKRAPGSPQPAKEPVRQQKPVTKEAIARIQEHIVQRQRQQQGSPQASFVLVWLVATALSLITAPLVEPRYFIIPWVMWRLHLPPHPTPLVYRLQRPRNDREDLDAKIATNFTLFLETYWYLAINAATGYIFLYNGFEWPQEPGKTQRFMW